MNVQKCKKKAQDSTEGHKRSDKKGKHIQGPLERLNILSMSILPKLIYTCKATPKQFFSTPGI